MKILPSVNRYGTSRYRVVSAILLSCSLAAAVYRFQYESPAPYMDEAAAVRRAQQLDLGEATLEGPATVTVDSLAALTLKFRVGQAGMKTGGGIRLAFAHGMGGNWGGYALQTEDPRAENYLSFRCSSGASLEWKPYVGIRTPMFERYHPWQNLHEFKLVGKPLDPGHWIEIKLGDPADGSPGVRMQQWDEANFILKLYVDAHGNDYYLPLANQPKIEIQGAEPAAIHVVTPSDVAADQPTWAQVWLGDAFGNPSAGFRGTVQLETSGATTGLPVEYSFVASDRGAHRFEGIRFSEPGVFRIETRVMDPLPATSQPPLQAQSNPIEVLTELPEHRIYWGDIHTHTMYSDGRGTPEETYDFGKRVSALDFCSVTDHAFTTTDAMWKEIQEVSNRYNEPGRYVTFLAYEWSGMTAVGGDHNVYTTESSFPLFRSYSYYNYRNLRMYHGPQRQANHVEDLFRLLDERYEDENILVIPHFGGRRGNPAWHNPKLQRQIEIFSDHRRSEDWTQSFLEKGYKLGIMASTDNHAGNAGFGVRRRTVSSGEKRDIFSPVSPAERGTALVAAIAGSLSRQGIFQALYHRRTYATTGPRIILRFNVDGAPMGSEITTRKPPRIHAAAIGTAPIQALRIVKNGKVLYAKESGSLSMSIDYTDVSGSYDNAYYYIDLVQTDGEKAISSPVWLN